MVAVMDITPAHRPRTGPSTQLGLRIPDDLKTALQAQADREGFTLSHHCARVLADSLNWVCVCGAHNRTHDCHACDNDRQGPWAAAQWG